jgi:exonuclease III
MITSQTQRSSHATASPGGDAPSAFPAAGAIRTQAGLVNNRKQLFIGCWNVRTLLDVGSQSLTIRTLHEYRVDIACLSEVRLPGTGSRRILVPGAESSYWLYHSGPKDASGQHGVAIAVSANANKALISWTPVSQRLATARFKGHPFNISVIAVYAPTLAADSHVKDDFYEHLQAIVNQIPRRDILVIAGDWNARTGPCDDNTRHILGRFGLGERCENGERLINFADLNRLCVSNTRFQHPRRHLLTWYSNDGRTANQIDYILVRARWASSIEDCRSYRGAEAGNKGGSDHTLVRAKFRLHLKTRQRHCSSKRLNLAPLEEAARRSALSTAIDANLALPASDQKLHLEWTQSNVSGSG